MSYHVVDISSTGACLSVKDDQLVCKNPDGSLHTLPMEDVGSVLVNSFSTVFHSSFVISAAEHKIPVIVCDRFKPVSMVLPVQRSSDTLMTRAQIQAPVSLLARLWMKTVDAKCLNQYELVERLCPSSDKELLDFRITLNRKDVSKEGNCARLYWNLYSSALTLSGFRRFRDDTGLNGLLNYGYAVLLLRVQQKLLACGLDPMYGMGHVPKERSLPLSYDIMEPFRPVVDEMVCEWVKQQQEEGPDEMLVVDQAYKKFIQRVMLREVLYMEFGVQPLDQVAELVIKSFRLALKTGRQGDYRPWIRRNSKWVG